MAATRSKLDKLVAIVNVIAAVAVALALVVLGIRAATRFDGGWDSLWYHLPFAARRAGMRIPYEMTLRMGHYYEGFPPLPELVQGLLWRFTGTMNATGVVNYVAFVGFLTYCHRVLRATWWLVAMVALTAPLVVIHSAVSYIDLFANSFLATSASACLAMVLFPERTTRAVLLGGLIGAAGTAWSKIQLAPLAVLFLGFVTVLAYRRSAQLGMARRRILAICAAATLVAGLPYAKNLVVYGNPVWPVKMPLLGDALPYAIDAVKEGVKRERPKDLSDMPQAALFVRSLFEIDYPDIGSDRARWTTDQGRGQLGAGPGFRMGGFWWFGVVCYLFGTLALFCVCDRRRGLVAIAGSIGVLGIVSVLPQSNELRYYMFLPLTWAAGFALAFPILRGRAPRLALGCMVVVLALFGYMVRENRIHYRIESRTQSDVVTQYDVASTWKFLKPDVPYCAVDAEPFGLLLTGPTLSEFTIIDRQQPSECPNNTIEIGPNRPPGVGLTMRAVALVEERRFAEALVMADKALALDPLPAVAWKTRCAALCELERWDEAVPACERAVGFHTSGSRGYLARARAHQAPVAPQ